MKKRLIFFLAAVLGAVPAASQDKLDIFGYFESQLMGTFLNDNYYQVYANKLRLDMKSEFSGNITFGANVNFITYHGKTKWDILEFLPPQAVEEAPPGYEMFYILPFDNRIYLDNAYLKLSFKAFDLTAGKQQISLGTGYAWNPTDVFNIKDFLDPTYEQPGHNAIKLELSMGTDYTLTLLYSPEKNWKDSAKMIQIKGRISHFDYILIAVEKLWVFHDYTQIDFDNMNFMELPERRRMFGFSTAGELFGIGIWAEYGYNNMNHTKDFYELVVGVDHTFDFQTYIMAEFYRNTLGKTDSQDYGLNDWMQLLAMEKKAISQDQIYVLARHPATDLLHVGISSVYSITDNSFVLIPTLNCNLWENVDIMAYLNLNFGKEGTAFSKDMGNGGLIRARIYF